MKTSLRHVALALLLALPASALAENLDPAFRGPGSLNDVSPQHRPQMVSVFLDFPAWYWGWGGVPFGVGARFYQPILHDGFAPINDSLGIEVGADLMGVYANPAIFGLWVPGEVMWSLHFSRAFAAYVKLGLALEVHFGCWATTVCGGSPLWLAPVAALGVNYKLGESVVLRAELGYPGLKVGLGFPL